MVVFPSGGADPSAKIMESNILAARERGEQISEEEVKGGGK